jgi:hypothetical protein
LVLATFQALILWYRNHKYLDVIDWCIDGFQNVGFGTLNYFDEYFGVQGPNINHKLANDVVDDLLMWDTDLVISDCDPFTAAFAKVINVPLWYCSPMLQMIGIEHDRKGIHSKKLDKIKRHIDSLPSGNAYLVYSPLCDIASRPFLKKGFEWVRPYSNKPNEISTENVDLSFVLKAISYKGLCNTGETSLVADCLYSGKTTFISPNPNDPEQVLNAQLAEWYGCARNIGRPPNIEFAKKCVDEYCGTPGLSIQKWKQLDERLDEYQEKVLAISSNS